MMFLRKALFRNISILCSSLLPAAAIAKHIETPQYHQERELYTKALQALEQKKMGTYQQLKGRLIHYPLYSYLLKTELSQKNIIDHQQKKTFINTYNKQPVSQKLHYAWLESLAKQGLWSSFIKNYQKVKSPPTALVCRYGEALYHSNKKQKALAIAKKQWLVPYSQPQNCDPLFKLWVAKKNTPGHSAWLRYVKAVRARQDKLANYIKNNYFNKTYKSYATLFQQVFQNPESVKTLKLNHQNKVHRQIFNYGIRNAVEYDLDYAIKRVNQKSIEHWLYPSQINRLKMSIARVKAYRGHKDTQEWINILSQNKKNHKLLRYLKIRFAIRQQQWQQAKQSINQLSKKQQNKAEWRYWLARSLEGLGQKQIAKKYYQALAKQRNYYGFLSADRLGQEYRIGGGAHAKENMLKKVAKNPAIIRAYELTKVGKSTEARKEWDFAMKGLARNQRTAASVLAYNWGMPYYGIRSSHFNLLQSSFPLSYQSIYEKYAKSLNMDSTWLMAVTRQESAFNHHARSPANARGLMQLLPSTARDTADLFDIEYNGREDLFYPATNIKLGSHYLKSVADRFSNHRILATASYNAGPHRVANWLKYAEKGLPSDIWIELIPFKETRKYVKHVLAFDVIYQSRLGKKEYTLLEGHEKMVHRNQEVIFGQIADASNTKPDNNESGTY